jgi:hypothetical protein
VPARILVGKLKLNAHEPASLGDGRTKSFHRQSAQSPAASHSRLRLRLIILRAGHWGGAHGWGYNSDSLRKLSQKLTPRDIPGLIALQTDQELQVGIEFALASQCEAAFYPVRDAAVAHKITFLDAEDTMRLIEDFTGCTSETRERATAMLSEIQSLEKADRRRLQQEAQDNDAEDARIQRNGLTMDPEQAKQLTRQEREEVFHRSVKAMGIKEDGPMTPAQKALVERMYRTMVLGESGNRPPN